MFEANTIFMFLFFSYNLQISSSSSRKLLLDELTQGQIMNSSQSIVSPNDAFELGFFSLDQAQVQSSTHPKRFYLGIWYKNIPPIRSTIVWVANRDKPIIVANNNSSCYLTLNSDGNLMIFSSGHDQKEAVFIYLTSISPAKNVTATLLDTGNFVLRDNNSINSTNIVSSAATDNFLWQSFDYPTDTFLPGMKLGFNYKIGWTWNLSSWRSPQDPSPGQYTLIVNTNTTEFQVLNGSQILWTSGPWNSDGKYFSFIPEMRVKGVYSFDYVSNPNEQYFHVIVNTNWFFLSRFLMNSSARIQQYFTWMGDRRDAQNWILFWEEPRKDCHVYRYCGAYSNCDQTQFPYCQCLKGFQPSSYKEWSEKQWTSGCARRSSLQCGDEDGFLLMRNTSLPLEPKSVELQSVEECKASCLGICSCTAFAYDSSVCLVWFGSLYNVRLADFNGSDLFVKLSASELKNFEESRNTSTTSSPSHHSRNRRSLSLVLALPITVIILILSSVVYCLWKKKSKPKGNPADKAQDLMLFDFNATAKRSVEGEGSSSSKLMMSGGSWDVELPFFSFASVCFATNNFSDQNRLGQGGFGPVYKGRLLNGHAVAIKRLSTLSCQGLEELKNEASLIAKLQHQNLVRLVGCCIEGEEKLLIYEYMPNKSLDILLFDKSPSDQVKLTWQRRISIIEGIAQGLLYLHKYSRLRIIHRDLKASNILLDDEMIPKISDFGMARIFEADKSQANTNRIVGTYGYMAPEYAMEGLFSIKSDVFSFGVLLLEIVSGQKNSRFHLSNDDSLNLIEHAWNMWTCERELELIDPMLGNPSSLSSSPTRFINIALLCVQDKPRDRPTMSEVISMLISDSVTLPSPRQPTFSSFGNGAMEEISRSNQQSSSINDVTLSSLSARS